MRIKRGTLLTLLVEAAHALRSTEGLQAMQGLQRRATLPVIVAVLALTGPFVQPAFAVTRACTSNTTVVHRWLERNWTVTSTSSNSYDVFRSSGQYTGTIGTAYVRNLEPCTGEGSAVNSFVLPANLDSIGSSGQLNGMVQLGYWEQSSGTRQFGYTVSDNAANECGQYGCMTAASWAETPELGNRYSFEIRSLAPGGNYWQYRVRDLTDSQTFTFTHFANWSLGERVWYGYESHDTRSNIGVWTSSASQARMTDMKRLHTNGVWSRIDGVGSSDYYYLNYLASPHVIGSSFPNTTTSGDTFNIYSWDPP